MFVFYLVVALVGHCLLFPMFPRSRASFLFALPISYRLLLCVVVVNGTLVRVLGSSCGLFFFCLPHHLGWYVCSLFLVFPVPFVAVVGRCFLLPPAPPRNASGAVVMVLVFLFLVLVHAVALVRPFCCVLRTTSIS